jgi:UDP-N-acetylmuramate dehydrogenase
MMLREPGTIPPPEFVAFLDELAAERGIAVERDVPLGPLTTLRVGGPAERLTVAQTTDELVAALRLGRDAGTGAGVLGKGSDIVVADAGHAGLVIRNRADGLSIDGTTIVAEAGLAMATLVKRCAAAGLAGIEFGIAIPGTVGGAVWANAGAHGREMKDVVRRLTAWSKHGDEIIELRCVGPDADCGFDYRDSRFKTTGEIVLSAELELTPGDPAAISERVSALQAHRRATQPLADQNAGSVFRNPSGDHAGRLIDEAGLKGFRIGSAEVSTLHANFIVADRGGRAEDVRAVGDHVRSVVADRFDIELDYEIEFVGEWGDPERWATPTRWLAGDV